MVAMPLVFMQSLNLNELYCTLYSIYTLPYFSPNETMAFTTLIFFSAYMGFIFNARNFLSTMIAMELVYLAMITSIITIAESLSDLLGYTIALFLIALAATESAIGLCLLTILFK
jgi:NADH-quinone oxidoreductase subunit K